MLGRERFGKYDKEAIKRLEGIQKMDADTKKKLFDILIPTSGILKPEWLTALN
ncbi:hypothetical protein [Zobellia uliginosa]|uniref:hypothetical protein n=1 Tax=Zobellia uliginosa TaxID=143224 RepID=UPI0026E305F0|nr:hypothetical protein [Zobellia uliginosa]MDO6517795.1 hypothetical protein [Zobellia uliginosa]